MDWKRLTAAAVLMVIVLIATGPKENDAMGEPEQRPAVGEVVRPAAQAGRFYSKNGEALAKEVDGYLERVPWIGGHPIAVVAPHAGYRYSGSVAGTAYASLSRGSYDRVFVLGVPHMTRVRGASIPKVTHYETPLGKVPVDRETADRLLAGGPPFHTNGSAHEFEHSVEVHLPFLQRALGEFRFVPMLVYGGSETLAAVAGRLRAELRRGDLVVASSDNTHYGQRFGYEPFPVDENTAANLKKLDMEAVDRILALDVEGYRTYKQETGITTCGYCPISVSLQLLPRIAKGTVTGYDTSAKESGDYASVVTYVGIAFTGAEWPILNDADREVALWIARESMERFVRTGEEYDAKAADVPLSPPFLANSGVFVTLRVGERLRGCIGDIFPVRPLHRAIATRAVSSATKDPRFEPVTDSELGKIHIEISVLSPPRNVASVDEIVIGKHGIVLSYEGKRRSVYLPQVAPEQGWDLEQTLSSLSRKGGLPKDAWRSPKASFQVFTAQVFGEDD